MSEPNISDLIQIITDAALKIYERGTLDERQRILQLASGGTVSVAAKPTPSRAAGDRVAHGTIRPLVMQTLEENPGLTKHEVGERVVALDPRVSAMSVVNELQRNDARKSKGRKLYKQRGNRWFLADYVPLRETAVVATNDQPPVTNGAGH